MATANWLLLHHLNSIAGDHFLASKREKHVVFFENRTFPAESFIVDCEFLSSNEVCKIARILLEVYSDFSDTYLHPYGFGIQTLCTKSVEAATFVSEVLALRGSSLHKFLLMSSGSRREYPMEVIVALARAKTPITMDQTLGELEVAKMFAELREYYILPGFDNKTVKSGYFWGGVEFEISNIEESSRLTAFVSDTSSTLTLKQHLEQGLSEGVRSTGSLTSMDVFETIQELLKSEYRELVLSMKPVELLNLTTIMRFYTNQSLPQEILQRRCAALDRPIKPIGPDPDTKDSVKNWVSEAELKSLGEIPWLWIDSKIHLHHRARKTPSIVYVAMAELLVTLGKEKAIEVVSSLEHLNRPHTLSYKMYTATTWLIAEAMKPENSDFPFAWIAQLSENAWVLEPRKSEEVALKP